MENLIELCRHEEKPGWGIVENSRFDSNSQEGLAAQLMGNGANDYVEYKNRGVVYRVIRKKDLGRYI